MSVAPVNKTVTVHVVSELKLVADTVAAALRERGRRVLVHSGEAAAVVAPSGPTEAPEAGLLLSRLGDPFSLAAGLMVVADPAREWVVVTSGRPGPAWGALLQAGAAGVLPERVTLEQLDERVRRAALVQEVMAPGPRALSLARWRALPPRLRADLWAMSALSPQERQVLRRLYQGHPVAEIAGSSSVAESTVRSQVRAVLAKLDRHTQLGAVALVERLTQSELFAPESNG